MMASTHSCTINIFENLIFDAHAMLARKEEKFNGQINDEGALIGSQCNFCILLFKYSVERMTAPKEFSVLQIQLFAK